MTRFRAVRALWRMGSSGAIAFSIIAADQQVIGRVVRRGHPAIASGEPIWFTMTLVGLTLRQAHAKGAGYRGTAALPS